MNAKLTRHERRVLRAAVLRAATADHPTAADKRALLCVIIAAARRGDTDAQRWLEEREVEWQS